MSRIDPDIEIPFARLCDDDGVCAPLPYSVAVAIAESPIGGFGFSGVVVIDDPYLYAEKAGEVFFRNSMIILEPDSREFFAPKIMDIKGTLEIVTVEVSRFIDPKPSDTIIERMKKTRRFYRDLMARRIDPVYPDTIDLRSVSASVVRDMTRYFAKEGTVPKLGRTIIAREGMKIADAGAYNVVYR